MVEKQRKRKRAEPEQAEGDAIARSLAAYGERFMQMFEDSAAQPSRGAGSQQRGGADSGGGGNSALSEGSDSDAGSSDLSSASSGGSGSEDEGDARGAEEFVFAANAVAPRSAGRQQQPRAARAPGLQGARPPTLSASPALDASLERKAFMSSKAARVHGGGGAAAAGGGRPGRPTAAAQEAEGVSREEFLRMQREVELYGATALDKKSRKRFEAAMLSKLGAKAAKSPRINAKIGLGMAKKAAQREARALEQAIDAGMVKRKGLGKKKREEKRKSLDRGLMEDGGAFRNGMLRVKQRGGSGASSSGGGGKRRF